MKLLRLVTLWPPFDASHYVGAMRVAAHAAFVPGADAQDAFVIGVTEQDLSPSGSTTQDAS